MEQVPEKNKVSIKAKVQRLGSTLSSMVMPNIGALIAWGVLTALFIPDGYLPNKAFATMVGPMLTYLIPLLIGYTGGKVIAGDRGAVVGAIATMGVIVGTDIPMMLGAMIMGPLGGFTIKKFDQYFQHRIKAGFEMLVNNFTWFFSDWPNCRCADCCNGTWCGNHFKCSFDSINEYFY